MTTIDRRTLLTGTVAALAAPIVPITADDVPSAVPPFQREEDAAILEAIASMEELLGRAKELLLKANGKEALLRHAVLFDMRSSLSAVRLWQDLLSFDVEDQRLDARQQAGLSECRPADRDSGS